MFPMSIPWLSACNSCVYLSLSALSLIDLVDTWIKSTQCLGGKLIVCLGGENCEWPFLTASGWWVDWKY